MTLKLVVLGFGGWVSNPLFGQPSYLLINDVAKIMLDAGEGTYAKLRSCTGLTISDIDYVIITHSHGDHVLGVPTMIQMARYEGKPLNIVGPSYILNTIAKLLDALWIPHYIEHIVFHEVNPGEEKQLDRGLRIKAVTAKHPVPSVSYIITFDKFTIAYSGDTAPNEEFLRLAKGSHLLIHEVSTSEELAKEAQAHGHTTSADIEHILSLTRPKYFLPTHYYISAPQIRLDMNMRVKLLTPSPCAEYLLP